MKSEVIVTTYNFQTSTGRHVRRASRVTFADGYEVAFMDLMSKRDAIAQAIEYRKREANGGQWWGQAFPPLGGK